MEIKGNVNKTGMRDNGTFYVTIISGTGAMKTYNCSMEDSKKAATKLYQPIIGTLLKPIRNNIITFE